jgi:ABC-2 type transport system ATP-binding protein
MVKISVASTDSCLFSLKEPIPAVKKRFQDETYSYFFSEDAGLSVPAILDYMKARGDRLVDLRVERPSLEERFLEITQNDPEKKGA